MADLKISQLTGASTPLAGTEVLPIVQSGTTKKVSVDNLTAGKAVSALSMTATNLKTSPTTAALDISGTTVAASGSDTNIDVTLSPKGTTGKGITTVASSDAVVNQEVHRFASTGRSSGVSNPNRGTFVTFSDANNATLVAAVGGTRDDATANFAGGWSVYVNATSGTPATSISNLTEALNFRGGNFNVKYGNVVMNQASTGINFTANTPAAGMTSQLLNWYEEGTFTPGLMFGTGTTGITYAGSTAARYVRIGKMVFVTGVVVLTNKGSSTGQAQVTGLPFNVASGADTVCTLRLDAVTFADVWNGVLFGTANKIFLYETTNAGASTDITDADFANNSSVYFNASYIAA